MDCGYFGIDKAECEANNCCWKESSVSGVPYCFHKVGESDQRECILASNLGRSCWYVLWNYGTHDIDCSCVLLAYLAAANYPHEIDVPALLSVI